jgi:hypothetical protein
MKVATAHLASVLKNFVKITSSVSLGKKIMIKITGKPQYYL